VRHVELTGGAKGTHVWRPQQSRLQRTSNDES